MGWLLCLAAVLLAHIGLKHSQLDLSTSLGAHMRCWRARLLMNQWRAASRCGTTTTTPKAMPVMVAMSVFWRYMASTKIVMGDTMTCSRRKQRRLMLAQ